MKASLHNHRARTAELVGQTRLRVAAWRRRGAIVAAIGLASAMAYGVVFGHNGLTMFAHKRLEARQLQEQMLALQAENERLRGHVNRLQNDPGAIEHQAREELHYTRAGEVIYTLPSPATGLPSPNAAP